MNWYKRLKFSGILPVYKERDFLRKLKDLGCQMLRQKGTSHQIWQCPGVAPFSVPISGRGDINPGLVHKIIKRILDITPQQFSAA